MSKCHFSFWLITSDWHPGQKGLSQRPHEDTLQYESSAVIQSFLTTSHLQIKISRCLACFLHCSCLPLEIAACAFAGLEIFGWQLLINPQPNSRDSPCSPFKIVGLRKRSEQLSSCKGWTLAHITSFARCSFTSVNQLKRDLHCQGNIQAWIWLMSGFIYLFIYLV